MSTAIPSNAESGSPRVKEVRLLRVRSLPSRVDVWITAVSAAIAAYGYTHWYSTAGTADTADTAETDPSGSAEGESDELWIPLPVLCAAGVAVLFGFLQLLQVPLREVNAAQFVFVETTANNGKSDIVPLRKTATVVFSELPRRVPAVQRSKCGTWYQPADMLHVSPLRFEFQSTTFELIRRGVAAGEDSSDASKNDYVWDPVDYLDKLPLLWYTTWTGWGKAAVGKATRRWGGNGQALPAPEFMRLLISALLSPLFAFQLLCLLLWLLDEYFYYALFTLGTLVTMEAMMVWQRMQQMSSLRKMRPAAPPVHVFRDGQWSKVKVNSDSLLPGDIISMTAVVDQVTQTGAASTQGKPHPSSVNSSEAIVPADCVILRGSIVANEAMLTGESTPMLKEALNVADYGNGEHQVLDSFYSEGSSNVHNRHVAFAGTAVIQGGEAAEKGDADQIFARSIPQAPDQGAVCVVVRTGFDTAQGELMRVISHSGDRVTAGNWEAFIFILGLLVFAIAASWYVLVHGWDSPDMNKKKLLLHCVMIITSVVPPELPIQLSLAVNSSLATLARRGIFCIEPFRIVYAGLVDTACFDKTGTLTADEFTVSGVVQVPANHHDPPSLAHTQSPELAGDAILVMAGCHSLMGIHQLASTTEANQPAQRGQSAPKQEIPIVKIVGDPMERAALRSIGWTVEDASSVAKPRVGILLSEPVIVPKKSAAAAGGLGHTDGLDMPVVRIVKSWAFSSEVKRMTTVASVTCRAAWRGLSTGTSYRILCKGAPDVILPFLQEFNVDDTLRSLYNDTYTALTSTGARVLALAYRHTTASELAALGRSKPHGVTTPSDVQKALQGAKRESVESQLKFAGFLVLTSPLKTDTVRTIRELQDARNRVVMVTGDAPLTAIAVSRHIGIVSPANQSQSNTQSGWVLELAKSSDQVIPVQWSKIPLPQLHDKATDSHSVTKAVQSALRTLRQRGEPLRCETVMLNAAQLDDIPSDAVVCVTGPAFNAVLAATEKSDSKQEAFSTLEWLLHRAFIFSRMNPSQKERLILSLNTYHERHPGIEPRYTLMCGDGTNDVGALKRSHVGVSIISNPTLERKYDAHRVAAAQKKREARAKALEAQLQTARAMGADAATVAQLRSRMESRETGNELDESDEELQAILKSERTVAAKPTAEAQPAPIQPQPNQQSHGSASQRAQQEAELKAKLAELQAELLSAGNDGGMVSLGDASIASPFTSKLPSPNACMEILRQGRCTLVSTHQVYRILAVNSLVLSYMLSVLYLNGVKTGDTQATAAGVVLTAFFMCISWAKPLKRLSPEQPRTSVFNAPLLISVFGQFIFHVSALVIAGQLSAPFAHLKFDARTPPPGVAALLEADQAPDASPWTLLDGAAEDPAKPAIPDKDKFAPNVLNTVIFLLSTSQQAVTFLVNYTGAPFMQPLGRNSVLLWGVLLTVVVCALGAAGLSEEISYVLELVDLPTDTLKWATSALIIVDATLCIGLELLLRKVFGVGKPPRSE